MPDIFKTRTELTTQALINLNATATGQEAEADDMTRIDAYVDPLIEQLASDGIIEIADVEEIPLAAFNALAMLLANDGAKAFGQQYSLETKMIFEAQLRRLTASRATHETLKVLYY